MSWRDRARPLIAAALEEAAGLPDDERAAHARAAFSWGERRYHPYCIWLSEVRVQMGWEQFPRRSPERVEGPEPAPEPPDPRQEDLFGAVSDLETVGPREENER